MQEAKKYEIRTPAEFLNIPQDKMEHCLIDLVLWLSTIRTVREAGFQLESGPSAFTWIDDDRHDVDITFRGTDGEPDQTIRLQSATDETIDVG